MKVRYSPRSLTDLESIVSFIAPNSPSGAANVIRDIRSTIDHLAIHPRLGRETDEAGVRVALTRRYRYRVFYAEGLAEVQILHVRHPARALPSGPAS